MTDATMLPPTADLSLLEGLRTGLTTFLGLRFQLEPGVVEGVVLGAPFDGGVLNRPGARLGPWALRAASLGLGRQALPLRLQGEVDAVEAWNPAGWVDGGNAPTRPFNTEEALQAVEGTVAAWAACGARTLLLGGDHLMTLGALRAHARRHGALGLLHVDAHPDAADGAVWGTAHHHGTWLRTAIEEGLVDPARTVQLGLRAPRHDDGELAWLKQHGVRAWTPWDLRDPHLAAQLRGDLARVGRGAAYVSLDLDALDPAEAPAVAEPVPAGLAAAELLPLLRLVHRWDEPWVGADLMELAPTLPGADTTARLAAHLALHLLG